MRYPKEETLKHRIYRELLTMIAEGKYPPGSELPSVRELMRMFSVSSNTSTAVLQLLTQEKIARARHNRRSKVIDKLLPQVAIVTSGAVNLEQFKYAYGAWGFEIIQSIYLELRNRDFLPVFLPVSLAESHWEKTFTAAVVFNHNSLYRLLSKSASRPLLHIIPAQNQSKHCEIYLDRAPAMQSLANYFTIYGIRSIGLLGDFSGSNLKVAIDNTLLPSFSNNNSVNIYRHPCGISSAEGFLAMEKLLAQSPQLPLGIFAVGDFAARGAIECGLQNNLKLKKDFLVTGCTGLAESAAWKPALSVLTTPFKRIGSAAAEVLSDCISGKTLPEKIEIKSKLIIRSS